VQQAIRQVIDGRDLSEAQAAAVAGAIMAGEATPAQIAGLLIALRAKGETVDEIVGFAQAMRRSAHHVRLEADDVIDTCGTGGDGAGTFNISTVSALVAAGAGCKVAKHGNCGVSSACGSADVLRALGVDVEASPAWTTRCIDQSGVGFLFAPQYHPGARYAAGPRREIGVRTIFNLLGPLLNPAGARRQLMGVYDLRLVEPIAEVLRRLGTMHGLVVCGADGLDEITITGKTAAAELKDGTLRCFTISPVDFGLPPARLEDIRGGDAEVNAEVARRVLAGEPGPARDVVLLNAGAAIYVGGRAETIGEGVRCAAEAIDNGQARAALQALIRYSRK